MAIVYITPGFGIGYQALDSNGLMLSRGLLYTYAAGTTTPLASYTTSAGNVAHANPIVLAVDGRIPAGGELWITSPAYKFVLKDRLGNLIATFDNVVAAQSALALLSSIGSSLIGFIQAGAGAIARTVQSKLRDTCSVLDFGAVGDGMTDDTDAITNALAANRNVVFPQGYTFKITEYIQIPANTNIDLYATIQLTNRDSGLFSEYANNINIDGHKIGTFTDPDVEADYQWNVADPNAPAIHLRSTTDSVIKNVNMTYVNAGVRISDFTTNALPPGGWVTDTMGTQPKRMEVDGCSFTFCENAGLCGNVMNDSVFNDNYVYRCGDGGLFFMGANRCHMTNNNRESPRTTAADCVTYGANILAHPTTWNDVQGIELESSNMCLVSGNTVRDVAHFGISIANSCENISVFDNFLYRCQSASIVVRDGDSVKNSVYRVSIQGNQIFNHGTSQFPTAYANLSYTAAICVTACYLADVANNIINSWQNCLTTPTQAIFASGPGAYLASQYPSNPKQAAISITDNKCWFKSSFQELFPNLDATATTDSAISVNGLYDSVKIEGNLVKADCFFAIDGRFSVIPAIILTYNTATINGVIEYYPLTASISDNTISNWMGEGIYALGSPVLLNHGLVIDHNTISGTGNAGILAVGASGVVITNNALSDIGSGAGNVAIGATGSGTHAMVGANVSHNNVCGVTAARIAPGGANKCTHGVVIDFGDDCVVMGNIIRTVTVASYDFTNQVGQIRAVNSTGFPRQFAATPIGAQYSYFIGEIAFDIADGKWFISSAIGDLNAWTQISN